MKHHYYNVSWIGPFFECDWLDYAGMGWTHMSPLVIVQEEDIIGLHASPMTSSPPWACPGAVLCVPSVLFHEGTAISSELCYGQQSRAKH